MRVSARRDDPGYQVDACWAYKILLDGEDVTTGCHTADEEKGMVIGYCVDASGQPYLDEATGFAAEQTMYGKVEIVKLQNGVPYGAEPC